MKMDLVIAFLICLFVGSCQEVDGVDGFTALTYVLNQALWHWESSGENFFIIPRMHGEDWSVLGK
ncbi:MAG: hypothetical protein ACJA16_003725 [Akkermansiaceae bacterium]|jgi:hypothetical protein